METLPTQLPSVPILAGLSEPALKLIADSARREVFQSGEFILREGESGNQMYCIESGSVRVFKTCDEHREKELAVLGPGDTFGEGCILTTLPRIASVQAITTAVVLRLSSMTYYDLYCKMPQQYGILMLNIARELSRRIRKLDQVYAACH